MQCLSALSKSCQYKTDTENETRKYFTKITHVPYQLTTSLNCNKSVTRLTQGHLQGDNLARTQKIIHFVARWYTHRKEPSTALSDLDVTEILSIVEKDNRSEPDLCRFLQYMLHPESCSPSKAF